jgi:hypothetical protein
MATVHVAAAMCARARERTRSRDIDRNCNLIDHDQALRFLTALELPWAPPAAAPRPPAAAATAAADLGGDDAAAAPAAPRLALATFC